jgi:hypothetical protein
MHTYIAWTAKNYPTSDSAYLQCEEATKRMVKAFPELTRVRGLAHVEEPFGLPPTRTPHWWLKTKSGEVVDPTAHQYPTRILKYEESDETQGPPTGKCPNCGGLCYNGDSICSKKCEREYIAYLNSPETW